jgi:hypothetical protein
MSMDISRPEPEEKTGRRRGRIYSSSQRIAGGSISTAGQGRRAELKRAINRQGDQFAALNFYDGSEQVGQIVGGDMYDVDDPATRQLVRRYLGIFAGRGLISDELDGILLTDSDFTPFPGFNPEQLPPSLGWSTSVGHPGDSPWTYVVALNPLVQLSDARKKDDIADIIYGLREILSLRPVSFRLKGHERTNLGFLAQEVKDIIPEAVLGSDKTTYSMTYETIIPVLVKAIQEQHAQIAQLTEEVRALRENKVQ